MKLARPLPLTSQTTISLSLYRRESTLTMAMKRDNPKMVGSRPRVA